MEFEKEKQKGEITPQKAQKILNEEGMDVTLEEAILILSFLKDMANTTVGKFLEQKEEDL